VARELEALFGAPLTSSRLAGYCRRWGSKPELIRQALAGAAGTQLQVPDAGGNTEAAGSLTSLGG
jgi:hypothetical protein